VIWSRIISLHIKVRNRKKEKDKDNRGQKRRSGNNRADTTSRCSRAIRNFRFYYSLIMWNIYYFIYKYYYAKTTHGTQNKVHKKSQKHALMIQRSPLQRALHER
jgi:hypothetical protein